MPESLAPGVQRARVDVDTRRWPLTIVNFVGSVTDEQFDLYLAQMDDVVAREGKRVVIYDATDCGAVPASLRRKQADWMQKHSARIRSNTAGIVFVLPSALLRGALTAIFWIHPLDAQHAIVKSREEAIERARDWLRD